MPRDRKSIPGFDDLLTDFSPQGHRARAHHTRSALTELTALVAADDNDRLAKDFIIERFETFLLSFSVHETGHTAGFMRSEIDRYLGWPAQAITYKIGQREWLAARADARSRDGDALDLKAWHMKALRLGAIGLDQLRAELAR